MVSLSVNACALREWKNQPPTANRDDHYRSASDRRPSNQVDFGTSFNPVSAAAMAARPDSVSRFNRCKSVRMSAALW